MELLSFERKNKCPYKMGPKNNAWEVGSDNCTKCKYFYSWDLYSTEVTCKYRDENSLKEKKLDINIKEIREITKPNYEKRIEKEKIDRHNEVMEQREKIIDRIEELSERGHYQCWDISFIYKENEEFFKSKGFKFKYTKNEYDNEFLEFISWSEEDE